MRDPVFSHREESRPTNLHAPTDKAFAERIAALSELKAGWLEGDGEEPGKAMLKRFLELWFSGELSELPNPYVYPRPDGGLQLEWDSGSWAVSAEVSKKDFQTNLIAVNVESGITLEASTSLEAVSGRSELAQFLSGYLSPTFCRSIHS